MSAIQIFVSGLTVNIIEIILSLLCLIIYLMYHYLSFPDKFKLLKGRNGGFCDRLTSSSYNASNVRNSSYKVELEVGGRNGNLSIGLYYPSTRQYQEIISYINM